MSNEVVLRNPVSLFPSDGEWTMLKEQATMAVKSGLLPRAVDSAEKAIVIALKGREIGIPPMQAFSHIHVVDGKPGFSAELQLGLIYKNCPGAVVNYIDSDEKKCVIEASRPGHKATRFSFTLEEARQAGLLSKNNWKSYPSAMLRARTISATARAMFPDATMGCSYTPEELGAEVDEDGEVVATTTPPIKSVVEVPKEEPKKPEAKKPPRGRKEIGIEIMTTAQALCISKDDVEKWAHEDFGKSGKDLTITEMESFLDTLQRELAGRGEIA